MSDKYPKLHNAMWVGVVGKGAPGAEPTIALDTLLELTANAEANGQKFDGVDLWLADPHVSIDSSRDDVKRAADHIAGYGLKVGSLVAPIWGGAGGGSAMGTPEERKKFVSQVRKAATIGKQMRDIGIRPTGGIRIDSSTGVEAWNADPKGNTRLIAETFREAGKIAADNGEFLVAEGEICWGGMQSWRENVNLLETVNMPDVVGYQADMAHSMLFTMGYNAEKDRLLPKDYDWKDKSLLDAAFKKVADALRPWTYDFHVAQNDGTVFGSGDHEKTGPARDGQRPERAARYRETRRLLAARRQGQPYQAGAPHLLGRLHVPERDAGGPEDLERDPRGDGQGARRARLERVGAQGDDDGKEEGAQHRPDRLRLHGPGTLQRVPQGRELLRPRL